MPINGFRISHLREAVSHSKGEETWDYEKLSKDIQKVTGAYIHPCDLKDLEAGITEDLPIRHLEVLYHYANEVGFCDWTFYRKPWEGTGWMQMGEFDPRDYKYNEKGEIVHREKTSGLEKGTGTGRAAVV